MEIVPFTADHIPQAANLFIKKFQLLKERVPALPDDMSDPVQVSDRLEKALALNPGTAVVENGRLSGYIMWFIIPGFRAENRKAGYSPEWAHAAVDNRQAQVYQALYRSAAAHWQLAGCNTHAVTLLAGDAAVEKFWFWNGFGLSVIDAVRLCSSRLGMNPNPEIRIRPAENSDIPLLCEIEAEHWQHYTEPPVLMAAHPPDGEAQFAAFLSVENNSAWLAFDGSQLAGYLRLESGSTGAASIVRSSCTAAITGLYVRPQQRGKGIAAALLDSALEYYAHLGFRFCSVDFESFNPEASGFWLKHFAPVCQSVIRVPER
jgi:GNAT superfamily N-acetyltransferase